MHRSLVAAVAVALAASAPAHAKDARHSFTQDDITYSYTVSHTGKTTIYKGYATPGGFFHLSVRDGRVTGMANGNRVAFDVPQVTVVKAEPSAPAGTAIAAAH
jgi:hypothetical protein